MLIDCNGRLEKKILNASNRSLSFTSSKACSNYELINKHKTLKYIKKSQLIVKTENTKKLLKLEIKHN